ncbi:hypothetical protein [Desulfofundulus thermocisternus]|uniref:hypothetical protein n=1 Tax=Desulfofundulus thermocisternus TaxID=42471 RepID=UPI0019EBB3E3|nr:hypothetical protein [Desulfofundulus thermocisternus]MBE3585774.1 hypothetical protein [Thermoanaerobacter sp.]MCS5696361.1 hypothetical protein [Desulfofundulus thermocisternus]
MLRDDKTSRTKERENDNTICPALEGSAGCPADNTITSSSCTECVEADDDL